MEKILCPGCSAPLRLDLETCGNCRRPWSDDEIQSARDAGRAAAARRRRLPVTLLAFLLAAAAGAGLYQRREILHGLAAGVKADFVHEMDATGKLDPNKPLSPMAQKIVDSIKVERGEPKAAPAPVAFAPAAPPAPPRTATRPPQPEEPSGPSAGATRLYGVVYDMRTAAPVAGATLVFRSASGMSWAGSTDSDGYYIVDVPTPFVDEGVTGKVTAAGYRDGQLEDSDPPYFERDNEARRAALEELAPSDLEPFLVRARRAAKVVSVDIVLAPAR